ncbi:chorismate-binding protein [Flagellimonas sp. HMM57]|uniref:chorismate-binding protein n=1 Tax=unclassified Flagellimonas TaxID=2644544 RepID=UPI0013D47AA6|nr:MULTISPECIES: chorismate-binding protein [unclassified Flagellimonas]UII76043.1 chorismate-binding protein [Flagellimonas sp. HMM57]
MKKANLCLKIGLPFSIYRKPSENEVKGIFQSTPNLNFTLNFEESGFVFAPFDLNDNAVLIKPDEIKTVLFAAEEQNLDANMSLEESGKDFHLNLMEKGIKEIRKGFLKKVVLSRRVAIALSKSPDKIFTNLLNSYQDAFCYWFFHPKIGIWCGATPETLMRIHNETLHTMSLAGTLPMWQTSLPEWGSKEIKEQEMVTDYIEDKLVGTVEELKVGKAKSVKAGKLWHLKSEITGKIKSKTKVRDIVAALHPTPAICGIPTDEAKAFIKGNENYERTFYTGFLGELNLNEVRQTSLFVNLRCMELKEGKAFIFVGGGITAASEPESEWSETQNKSKTMLRTIQ